MASSLTCKEALSSNNGWLVCNFRSCLLLWLNCSSDVEGSFSTLQLFSLSFLFVTRQISIGHGSRMRNNNNAWGVVHTMHKFVYSDVNFLALLRISWNWGESKSSQTCLAINGTDWYQKWSKKFMCSCQWVSPSDGKRREGQFLSLAGSVCSQCNGKSTRCKITHQTRWWRLEVLKVYRFGFVMYYVYVTSGPSLLIESTDSMIICYSYLWFKMFLLRFYVQLTFINN